MDDLTPEDIISGRGNDAVAAAVAQEELAREMRGLYVALQAEGFTHEEALSLTGAALIEVLRTAPE